MTEIINYYQNISVYNCNNDFFASKLFVVHFVCVYVCVPVCVCVNMQLFQYKH